MKGRFGICLLCGFTAEGALRFLVLPRMGWLPGLLFALAVTVLVLLFYLILTRGVPMAGSGAAADLSLDGPGRYDGGGTGGSPGRY